MIKCSFCLRSPDSSLAHCIFSTYHYIEFSVHRYAFIFLSFNLYYLKRNPDTYIPLLKTYLLNIAPNSSYISTLSFLKTVFGLGMAVHQVKPPFETWHLLSEHEFESCLLLSPLNSLIMSLENSAICPLISPPDIFDRPAWALTWPSLTS